MRFHSALTVAATAEDAGLELTSAARDAWGGAGPIDLAFLFFTGHHADSAPELAGSLRATLGIKHLLGVSCEGVIGERTEIERVPAVALLTARLPGVNLQPFAVEGREWSELLLDEERLQRRLGTGPGHAGQILLSDPFSTPIDEILPGLDVVLGRPTVGGMASGSHQPGGNILICNDRVLNAGSIGVGIGGALSLTTLVSQGCRPIGRPMVVTRSDRNVILELGRRPALAAAQEMLRALPPEEAEMLTSGLLIGVVLDEYRSEFTRGDFLIRPLMGGDREAGSIVMGDLIRSGQTIQFHVRDASTATEDLRELLTPHLAEPPPAGALIFSCNGRGSRLFEEAGHDLGALQSAFPGLPTAGFFAMGELGPIAGRTHLHGHTASMLLIHPA